MGTATDFIRQRAIRDAAREKFDLRLAQVREDLDARGVGGRIADRIEEEARSAWESTAEILGENRGVVAGTIVALALWLLRNPIIAWLDRMMDRLDEE